MQFDWDARKAAANVRKHGVSFEEAATVFHDPHHLSDLDRAHAIDEDRWITIGVSYRLRVLVVVTTELVQDDAADDDEIDDLTVRIISARQASRSEAREYEEARKRSSRGS
jgi:uncharacterized protein